MLTEIKTTMSKTITLEMDLITAFKNINGKR